jgi:hypothetical protein
LHSISIAALQTAQKQGGECVGNRYSLDYSMSRSAFIISSAAERAERMEA